MGSLGQVEAKTCRFAQPLPLKSGRDWPTTLVYETYGTLNADKSNAVLVCHASTRRTTSPEPTPASRAARAGGTTSSARASRWTPIASSSSASTTPAPASAPPGPCVNPATGRIYGADFPVVTVEDWVDAQARLLDRLGIRPARRRAGRQPGRHAGALLVAALPEAAAPVHGGGHGAEPSAQNIAFNEGGAARHRHRPRLPRRPLLRARRGPEARSARGAHDRPHHLPLRRRDGWKKFGAACAPPSSATRRREIEFEIESYLRHQGDKFSDISTPTPTC